MQTEIHNNTYIPTYYRDASSTEDSKRKKEKK